MSEPARRHELSARIALCAGRVDEWGGDGSVRATRMAVDYCKQMRCDVDELLASLEARYAAIKDMPAGVAGVQ